jgi:beta-glucanase (GH16 family)
MNKLNIFLVILSLFVTTGCAGCSDNDDNVSTVEISVKGDDVLIAADGGVAKLTIESNDIYYVDSNSPFATVSKKSGVKGTSDLDVTFEANTSYTTRTAIIALGNKDYKKEISITQSGKEKPTVEPNSPETSAPDGYELVWSDEFDGANLSSDWTYEVQNSGWVNNELQNYRKGLIDGKYTVEVKDGLLNINCFKGSDGKIYSGRIKAKESTGWKYGYIEARIKLPKGKGTWPAFWMMPCKVDWEKEGWPKCGEIDIMEEVGANPNYVSSSLHAEGHVHTLGNQVTHEMLCEGAEDDFHTYTIEWSKEKIVTYVDGKLQLSYKSDGTVKNYPYDKAYYIILNLAWGGDWGGYKGIDESALPTSMLVDYVRVFQKK